ncbi:MAG: peptide chain release factor H [Williamsia sp.]|nr:peptide chain release factor H [Williamsia sp.]
MEKMIIQITAGRGSVECCRVVAKVEERLLQEARTAGFEIKVLDHKQGELAGTLLSATLLAQGENLSLFTQQWQGTIQWIAQSLYRRYHKRKNWFVGVSVFPVQDQLAWNPQDIVFETCRASGPGGQHVNKVETAVRGTHLPSGLQVLASDNRSQLQNKKLCLERLKAKVLAWHTEQLMARQQLHWEEHRMLERGNAVRTFTEHL